MRERNKGRWEKNAIKPIWIGVTGRGAWIRLRIGEINGMDPFLRSHPAEEMLPLSGDEGSWIPRGTAGGGAALSSEGLDLVS